MRRMNEQSSYGKMLDLPGQSLLPSLKVEEKIMPTEKPRYTITLDEEMLKKIDDFRFENRFSNRTQATLELFSRSFFVIIGYSEDS